MPDFHANLRVVLVEPRNPLNIGAAARATANFGFSRLRVVNPYEKAFREAVSAVGGAGVLQAAEVFSSVAEAVVDCTLVVGTTVIGNRELQHPLWRLEAASAPIRGQAAGSPVAILFGCEKFGLSNDDMSHCHWLMRIPTSDQTPSMNLGQAVAVCLYELSRDAAAEPAGPLLRRSMRSEDAEQLTQMLLDVLRESGYMNRIIATSTERKVRRFLRRVNLTSRDAVLLMGFLRQILWKFRV
ncbi:MAG: TrmJ/YjtD family RNA methyltransferase [Acidobacteriota bacterium]|nr:TrmJ/YjtD family RNA methyltransferase [Acidobacteriota bacterium]